MDVKQTVLEAAALRGQRRFNDAIELVEKNYEGLDPDLRVMALIEAFKAADEATLVEKAKALAHQIAIEEPDLPSIQSYL